MLDNVVCIFLSLTCPFDKAVPTFPCFNMVCYFFELKPHGSSTDDAESSAGSIFFIHRASAAACF